MEVRKLKLNFLTCTKKLQHRPSTLYFTFSEFGTFKFSKLLPNLTNFCLIHCIGEILNTNDSTLKTTILRNSLAFLIRIKFSFWHFSSICALLHISRILYIFYPIIHCGLYCSVVCITDNLCTKQRNSSIFGPKIRGL